MERDVRDPVAELAQRVADSEPRLDALARQRILKRVHAQVEAEQRARPRRKALWSALAAAAAVLWVWLGPGAFERARVKQGEPLAQVSKPAQPPAARAPAPLLGPAQPLAPALAPYLVASEDPARAAALLGSALREIELRAGERVLMTLSDRARFALLGPARVSLRAASQARLELSLERGLLVGEYDRARGGQLVIHAPGATTEVTGTLFSLRVQAQRTRVAVAHGSVIVRVGETQHVVGSGQALPSGARTPTALAPSDAAPLRELQRALPPPAGAESGTLSVAGARREVDVDGHLLGSSPVSALVPAGKNRVTLRGGKFQEELSSFVHARDTTQVVLAAPDAARRALVGPAAPMETEPPQERPPAEERLYAQAEAAMQAGDAARASALLNELVQRYPDAHDTDLALYELALLAHRHSDRETARAWLLRLDAHGTRAALREPVRSLRCKLWSGDDASVSGGCR